eukprot:TRINITY_DN9419_c0_g1_i2.p1 TRINITY_DN9419_c0_g1~~TRINITY_DN9419_c0_g1_i2.p1  ORF type:complete len:248 (+),score=72.33 TRINITY_DN9419_c0_g1_i2:312-1055(+)
MNSKVSWGGLLAGSHQRKKQSQQGLTTSASAAMRTLRSRLHPNRLQKKKKKDPNAPKRPVSAFMYFQKEKLPEAKLANPGVKVTDVRKMVAKMWDELPDEKGKPYRDQAREDKKRYEAELIKYQNKPKASESDDDDGGALPPPPPPPPPPADSDSESDDEAPIPKKGDCKYGANCYRTSAEHLRDWNHPKKKNKTPPSDPPVKKPKPDDPPATGGRKRCEYGSSCFRTAPQHFVEYSHSESESEDSD